MPTSRLPTCSTSWPGPWPFTSAEGEYTRSSSNGMENAAPSSKAISSTFDSWRRRRGSRRTCRCRRLWAPTIHTARSRPRAASYEHPLDAAVVGVGDVVRQPVLAQQVARHLDDDVVGRGARVIVVARQALQA